MTDLFWPGDERAGTIMTSGSFLGAMVAVEQAWLDTLVGSGIAPSGAEADLGELVGRDDIEEIAATSEAGGNPVIPLLSVLRERLRSGAGDGAAGWLHRGLTSQDVVDTALVLCCRDALDRLDVELAAQATALAGLAQTHRDTLMVGRTLTQHAVPVTFGLKAAGWLTGVLDAADAVRETRELLAVQVGGAAGSMAAAVELARLVDGADAEARAVSLAESVAAALGLAVRMPWHTSRAPVTRIGDAVVTCTDAWGRIASDVLVSSRPEIGELAEPSGTDGQARGGSSTMPQKRNPVLSVLVRRASLASPSLGATLHTASSLAVDERPDGSWHVEWATLRDLCRRAVVAGSQTSEVLGGLRVDVDRMRVNLDAAGDAVLAERRAISRDALDDTGVDPGVSGYLGATHRIIDAVVARASTHAKGRR